MNLLDIIVILIIVFFAANAYRKGFVKACFGSLPLLLALGAAYLFQPVLSRIIRGTALYDTFKNSITQSLGLDKMIEQVATNTQSELIRGMNLPEFLKSALIENNNPVVYQVLNVSEIQDYIAGFIANICINILTMAIVFFVALIASKLFLATLNMFAKLPILSFFNKITGLAVGVIQGFGVLWVVGIFLTFFHYNPKFQVLFDLLSQSTVAGMLYENNLLLFMILKIFT